MAISEQRDVNGVKSSDLVANTSAKPREICLREAHIRISHGN